MAEPRVSVRSEWAADHEAVHRIHKEAFGQPGEAELVRALRPGPCISLVAERDGSVVGHILFTPVEVEGEDGLTGAMGLGPMAVEPGSQRQGIGSALVLAGLDACRTAGVASVFVLGHPGYYPRFGFASAAAAGFGCDWDVPDDVFLVIELAPGSLEGRRGAVKYHPEFSRID